MSTATETLTPADAAAMLDGSEITRENHEYWLHARLAGLGASEVAAAMGVNKDCTPLELYARKLGLMAPVEENRAMRFGRCMESAIKDEYELESGQLIVRTQVFCRWPETPFQATLDAIRQDGRTVEFKYVGSHSKHLWGAADTDEVPVKVVVQAYAQMAARNIGCTEVDVAAAFGDHDFRTYTVYRDDRVFDSMVERVIAFQERIDKRLPPEPQAASDTEPLRWIYPDAEGAIELDDVASALVKRHERMGRTLKRAGQVEESRKLVKAQILAALGESAIAVARDGTTVKRRLVETPEGIRKASSYMGMWISKPKGK